MSTTLKERVLSYLMKQPMRWVSANTVKALIERAGYSPSSGPRLLRELTDERLIEQESSSFRYNPDTDQRVIIRRMGEWFEAIPEKTDEQHDSDGRNVP